MTKQEIKCEFKLQANEIYRKLKMRKDIKRVGFNEEELTIFYYQSDDSTEKIDLEDLGFYDYTYNRKWHKK